MAPQTSQAPQRRNRTFKMRLTNSEADQLKSLAHSRELSQADFGRLMLLGQAAYSLQDSSKLETIARQLVGIGTNLNQAQKSIHEAQISGTLSASQFAAMHRAIAAGHKVWSDPLAELRHVLKKIRPTR